MKYKRIPYLCRICKISLENNYQPYVVEGKITVPESSDETVRYDLCKDPKCKWEDQSQAERLLAASRCGVGKLFIRNEVLPSINKFPIKQKINIHKPAYIVGPVGTGKTWLLSCIICDALAEGLQRVDILSWAWFQLEIRDTYNSSSMKTELDVMKQYINLSILCIDDIGSGKDIQGRESEAARVNLLALLDKRYSAELVTHFSGNLSPDKLAKRYDDRIASRIQDTCTLVVLTKNLRQTM